MKTLYNNIMERVYKYNVLWQLVRAQNKKEKYLQNKLQNVMAFLYRYPSAENRERVLNYLEGLALGYRDPILRSTVYHCRDEAYQFKPKQKDIDIPLFTVSTDKLLLLYNDLYKRNSEWLNNNYRNLDLNEFLRKLYLELQKRNVEVDKNFDIYPKGKSKHKFVY